MVIFPRLRSFVFHNQNNVFICPRLPSFVRYAEQIRNVVYFLQKNKPTPKGRLKVYLFIVIMRLFNRN